MFKKDSPNKIDGGYIIIYPLVDKAPKDEYELSIFVWKDAQMATIGDITGLDTEFTSTQLRNLAKGCLEAAQALEIIERGKGK